MLTAGAAELDEVAAIDDQCRSARSVQFVGHLARRIVSPARRRIMAAAAASGSLRVFADMVSQPSRAIVLFCKVADIPHTVTLTRIAKGENRATEFVRALALALACSSTGKELTRLGLADDVNPVGQVPAIVDVDGFCLAESHAILKYLCATRPVAPTWYPADPKVRARVDQMLDFHHARIRRGCAPISFGRAMGPLGGIPVDSEEILAFHGRLARLALKDLEGLLGRHAQEADSGPYLAGTRNMTISDISTACELEQLEALVDADKLFRDLHRVNAWRDRVRRELEPHWTDVNRVLRKVIDLAHARGCSLAGTPPADRSSRL